MSAITIYTFVDESGNQDDYMTPNRSDAMEYATEGHLKVLSVKVDYHEFEIVADYTEDEDEDETDDEDDD